MKWVIGDVHGQYDMLMRLLGKLNLTKDDEVYFVGDFMDRPKDNYSYYLLLRWILTNLKDGTQYHSVCGNHDRTFVTRFKDYMHMLNKRYNTLDEYSIRSSAYDYVRKDLGIPIITDEEIDSLISIFTSLPTYIELDFNNEKYIITHSWLCDKNGKSAVENLDRVSFHESVWDRYHSLRDNNTDVIVIHGHTPTCFNTDNMGALYLSCPHELGTIVKMKNNIAIDCGGFVTFTENGNLAAYCIDTGEEVYTYSDKDKKDYCIQTGVKYNKAMWLYFQLTGDILELNEALEFDDDDIKLYEDLLKVNQDSPIELGLFMFHHMDFYNGVSFKTNKDECQCKC